MSAAAALRVAGPLLALGFGLAVMFLGGRPPPAPAPAPTGDGLGLAAGARVEYRLEWAWDGARRDGDALVFTTDLGYTVAIAGGEVGSASLELVPCAPRAEPPRQAQRGPLAWLRPRTAAAAHAHLADDSRVEAPVLEALADAAPLRFGAGTASGRPYCALHYLIAPVIDAPSGASAAIRGWYSRPGATARVPFDAAVTVRGGAVRDLEVPAPTDAAALAGGATVVLRRFPARALDGAALERLTPRELAYAFLRGLGRGARVSVAAGPR